MALLRKYRKTTASFSLQIRAAVHNLTLYKFLYQYKCDTVHDAPSIELSYDRLLKPIHPLDGECNCQFSNSKYVISH